MTFWLVYTWGLPPSTRGKRPHDTRRVLTLQRVNTWGLLPSMRGKQQGNESLEGLDPPKGQCIASTPLYKEYKAA